MSDLSILNCFKINIKLIFQIIVIAGILFKNVRSSDLPVFDESDAGGIREKLPFCDGNLIKERDISKR